MNFRPRALARRFACIILLALPLAALVSVGAMAQTTGPSTGGSTPSTGSTSHGGSHGSGAGVSLDLGSLFGGKNKPPTGIVLATNSLGGAAKGPATKFEWKYNHDTDHGTIVDHGVITDPAVGPCVDQSQIAAFAAKLRQQIPRACASTSSRSTAPPR